MANIKSGKLMSNGKRRNYTVAKYTLKGEKTGKYTGIVFYSPKNFVNSDEFDVVVKMVHRDGKEVDISVTERVEFHSAALNDYFINHDAA